MYVGSDHITKSVNSYYIAGYGSEMTTNIEFNSVTWVAKGTSKVTDSVVPVWSACLADKYEDRTFYATGIRHTELLSSWNVKAFVIRLIIGNTSTEGCPYIEEQLP